MSTRHVRETASDCGEFNAALCCLLNNSYLRGIKYKAKLIILSKQLAEVGNKRPLAKVFFVNNLNGKVIVHINSFTINSFTKLTKHRCVKHT